MTGHYTYNLQKNIVKWGKPDKYKNISTSQTKK